MASAATIQVQVLLYQDYGSFFLLFSESPAMNGKTPIEMLKQGEIEAVVVEARAVGVGW